MPNEIDKSLIKEAFKEGAKEWLDDQMKRLGWWTFRGLSAAGLFALLYFILTVQGWKK
jgi:hypothetical protein